MTEQNKEALRLANFCDFGDLPETAAHLRRLVAENEALRKDADRLDFLDTANEKFRVGWKVCMSPGGKISIVSVIELTEGPVTSLRSAIDVAMKDQQ